MRPMRALAALALLATLGARLPAQQGARPGAQQVERGHALDSAGSVRIYNLAGSVRVIGWRRDSVSIAGSVGAGERLMSGGGRAGVKVVVEPAEGLAATGATAGATAAARGAELVVRVPRGARVWVKGGSTEVRVTGVTGGLDLNAVDGPIRVVGSPRELSAETMNGTVSVDGAPAWMRAKTATGAITLRGSGGDVRLSSVSGAVTVSGGRFDQLAIETVTGKVRMGGAVAPAGALTVDTHAGDVELRLPRAFAGDIHAASVTSQIENRLTAARPVAGRGAKGSELHSAGSGGGPRVTVRSFKGRVELLPAQ